MNVQNQKPDDVDASLEFELTTDDRVSLDDLVSNSGAEEPSRPNYNGVFVGCLTEIVTGGLAIVQIPGLSQMSAKCTVAVSSNDVGKDVAVMFEQGDSDKPLLIGVIQQPANQTLQATVDDERLVLSAEREIVLKCGKASITLTRAGKILLRGAYLSSRSSGVNRIKGGSVQIN